MNFYLSAIDDLLRHETDQLTIGLILCKSKNQIVAEYALRDMTKPLGISQFRHLEMLPEQLKGTLPTNRPSGTGSFGLCVSDACNHRFVDNRPPEFGESGP